QLSAHQPLDEAFSALAWQLLGNSQRLAEQYSFSGHWKLLEQWLQQLLSLRALLASLGQAAPRASSSALREQLDALLEDWREVIQSGSSEQSIRAAMPEQFANELKDTRWGQFSLHMALWLQSKQWQEQRNARGARQGAAGLQKWLLQYLTTELEALQVARYIRQPEDFAEQTPRLERLLVWLQAARQVTELTEVDR